MGSISLNFLKMIVASLGGNDRVPVRWPRLRTIRDVQGHQSDERLTVSIGEE
jgi:hypothetical protein